MWLLIVVALIVGAVAPVQAGINSQLRFALGHPILASTVSFMGGTLALAAIALAVRAPVPDVARMAHIPWWMWTGGLLGAAYVSATLVLAPRLGAATLMAVTVAGQMACSMALDHYGLVGYELHPASALRLVGVGFVVAGVILIQRF